MCLSCWHLKSESLILKSSSYPRTSCLAEFTCHGSHSRHSPDKDLQGLFPESWQLALAYLLRTTLAFSFPSLHPALSIGIRAIKLSKRVSPPLRSACRPLTTVMLVSTAGDYPRVGPWGVESYRSARYQVPLCYLQEYSAPVVNILTSNRQACASVSFLLCLLLKLLSWDCSGLPPTQGHALLYIWWESVCWVPIVQRLGSLNNE